MVSIMEMEKLKIHDNLYCIFRDKMVLPFSLLRFYSFLGEILFSVSPLLLFIFGWFFSLPGLDIFCYGRMVSADFEFQRRILCSMFKKKNSIKKKEEKTKVIAKCKITLIFERGFC